jgi:two-component system response regulator VicR
MRKLGPIEGVDVSSRRYSVTKKRILCIEDHPEMIELVRLILERRGFEVEGAIGGKEGLEAIDRSPPDLILLDLMMPDVDGWEVYRQIKSKDELRGRPVIVITAKAQGIDRVLGLHIAGVDDYITKPFGPKELIDSVERFLGRMEAGESVEHSSHGQQQEIESDER